MKEKIKELFKNGWMGLVVALVITILLMTEEKKILGICQVPGHSLL